MARLLRLWGTKALAKFVTLVLRRSKLKTQSIFPLKATPFYITRINLQLWEIGLGISKKPLYEYE